MKYLLFAIILFLYSCKKNNPNQIDLIGKWELHSVDNFVYQVYPPGNGNILEFTTDSFFIKRPNYADLHTVYRNISKSVCNLNNATVMQVFDNFFDHSWKDNSIVELKGDTLTLLPVCMGPDNYGSVYWRIH